MQIQKIGRVDKGKFGTGEGLLWYGICARCEKQASVVRDAFSEAFGVQNRLLWYAARFLRHSVRRTGFYGTEEIFGTGNGLLRYGVHLHSEALGTGNPLLRYGVYLQSAVPS